MPENYIYSLEDCSCVYCLYYIPGNKCQLEKCCCIEEKKFARRDSVERFKRELYSAHKMKGGWAGG